MSLFCLKGTTEYTLPEWYQQNSRQYVPSIVWQIGTVLYVMLNGKRPFRTTREMISMDPHMREELSQGECVQVITSL